MFKIFKVNKIERITLLVLMRTLNLNSAIVLSCNELGRFTNWGNEVENEWNGLTLNF